MEDKRELFKIDAYSEFSFEFMVLRRHSNGDVQ